MMISMVVRRSLEVEGAVVSARVGSLGGDSSSEQGVITCSRWVSGPTFR